MLAFPNAFRSNKAESNYVLYLKIISNLTLTLSFFSSRMAEIPFLQGMAAKAAKELYVGHSSKFFSCIGCSLTAQRHLWLAN